METFCIFTAIRSFGTILNDYLAKKKGISQVSALLGNRPILQIISQKIDFIQKNSLRLGQMSTLRRFDRSPTGLVRALMSRDAAQIISE